MEQSQIVGALRDPATPVDRSRDSDPDWYLDWAYNEVKGLSDAHKLGNERVLTVRLALDTNLQRKAEDSIEAALRESGRAYHVKQSATVVMEPNGAVRAIVGGRDYGESQFNRATDALRQPGSSFKPYVYLTALLSGRYKPSTIVVDGPVCLGNWCPRNYGGSYAGSLPLFMALAKSLNTVAVKLSIGVGDGRGDWDKAKSGRAKIIDTARRMGLSSPLNDTVSLPIGAAEVYIIEHSATYAAFANGGKRVKPWGAMEVMNSRGETIYRHDVDGFKPVQTFPPDKIADMDSMLFGVVREGTGRAAQLGPNITVGGKTGTTNGYKDAWFCGFTGNFAGCIWFGNDDDTSMNNMTGGSLPARTWHEIMEFAHRGIEITPIPGVPATPPAAAPTDVVASVGGAITELGAPSRPTVLSRRSAAALGSIEQLVRTSGSRVEVETIGTTIASSGPGGGARSVGGAIRLP
jgi:penicillin-binding protein 1A